MRMILLRDCMKAGLKSVRSDEVDQQWINTGEKVMADKGLRGSP